MTDNVLQQVKALDPAPGDLPEAMWSPAVVLQQIDERSTTVQTQERKTEPAKRNRGWLLAAAVAALVVLIGAAMFGLTRDSGTDVVEPTPTTLSAPTTLPTPTTTPPATTVPVTTQPPATAAPVVFEPQTYAASMTWDGETCLYDGPRAARAGDTLTMTFTNNTALLAGFDVGYLTGDATREQLVDYLGASFNISNYVAPTFALSWHPFTESGEGFGAGPLLDRGQLLQAGRSVENTIDIELARNHVFVCHGGPEDATAAFADVPVDVAATTVPVVEQDQPLPELPPQVLEATVTWDGETCNYEGPTSAQAGDTLSLTVINNTGRFGRFLVMYVASGTSIEDVSAYFDDELGNVLTPDTPGWNFPGPNSNVSNTTPPAPFNWVDEFGAIQPGGEATLDITIRQPREHVFTCEGADDGNNQSSRYIDNAPLTVTVTD